MRGGVVEPIRGWKGPRPPKDRHPCAVGEIYSKPLRSTMKRGRADLVFGRANIRKNPRSSFLGERLSHPKFCNGAWNPRPVFVVETWVTGRNGFSMVSRGWKFMDPKTMPPKERGTSSEKQRLASDRAPDVLKSTSSSS